MMANLNAISPQTKANLNWRVLYLTFLCNDINSNKYCTFYEAGHFWSVLFFLLSLTGHCAKLFVD